MRIVHLILLCMLASFFSRCSTSPVAGGTTDTGNARVSAVLYTDAGDEAVGADVTVCPESYVAEADSDSPPDEDAAVLTFVTDEDGRFTIDSIAPGDYSIEVNDRELLAVLLHVTVPDNDDSSVVLEDTLQPYAIVEGDAGAIADSSIERYCVVYGLDRMVPVAADGSFLLDDLPPGEFHLSVIAGSPEWEPVEFDSVDARSSDTVHVAVPDTADPVFTVKILLNTSASGADVAGTVYDFPVLVRLTDSIFAFSEAAGDGSTVRFLRRDSTMLPFAIEQWDSAGGTAAVWVLLDTVNGDDTTQYFLMQWGAALQDSSLNERPVFDTAKGFLAGYHLAESLDDATVNGYDGIDSGTTSAPDGLIGAARSFDGVSQYFSVKELPDRPNGSFSFWFRPQVTFNEYSTPTQGIWGKYISDGTDYGISLRSSDYFTGLSTNMYGTLIAKLEDQDTGYYLSSTENSFDAGEWYHVACIWSEGAGNRLYINGKVAQESTLAIPIRGEAPDEFGRCQYDTKNIPFGPVLYFRGSLDEIRFETARRSTDWVRLCYMNQREDDRLVTVEQP